MATTDITTTKEQLLERYKKELPEFWDDEKYKWKAVKHFQDNWDIDAADFGAMFTEATKEHHNLLSSGNYYARKMIQEFAAADMERTRSMFHKLFDESLDLTERVQFFMDEAEAILQPLRDKWGNHYQDLHAISVYLAFRYPERYFIYKYTELKNYVQKAGDDFVVRKSNNLDYFLNVLKYTESIRATLVEDEELSKLIAELTTKDNCYTDEHKNVTTVDFVYYVGKRLSEQPKPTVVNDKPKPRFWIYAPGESACKWELCLEESLICIGWEEMGDVSDVADLEQMKTKMKSVFGEDKSYANSALAVWEFSHVMKPGDIIYAKQGKSKIIGRGIVTGDYSYNDSLDEYNHIRTVEWTHRGLWKAPWSLPMKTLTETTAKSAKELDDVLNDEEIPSQPENEKHYWWLVASPKIWSVSEMKIGDTQSYTLYNDNGNKRRIYQNFLNAKAGDIVIGYEATPIKQIVAILEIDKESDGELIWFKKKESLATPIDFAAIKSLPELEKMEFFANLNGSLFKLTEDEFDVLMGLIRDDNPLAPVTTSKPYSDDDFLSEVYVEKEDLETLKSLLLRKKNLILQGAPGVGKAFAARRLAYAIMGEVDNDRIEQVQFHQNYSYEDFLMGYKPNEDGGFDLQTGVFYRFCKKALADSERPYFFIIDEINRGNLSKIFGELLMLIENDYRDKPIRLSYRDEKFAVPSNLYIIGMMNTADRSLAMIDYALRRRFSFFEMRPGFESSGFKNYLKSLDDANLYNVVDAVIEINKVITKDDSLGSGFCIGHSYFCNFETVTVKLLKSIVEFDIIPMLREYWFDDDNKFNDQSRKLREAIK